jgi:hypothetical protein
MENNKKVGGRPFVCIMYLIFVALPFSLGGGWHSNTSANQELRTPVVIVRDQRSLALNTTGIRLSTFSPVKELMAT